MEELKTLSGMQNLLLTRDFAISFNCARRERDVLV